MTTETKTSPMINRLTMNLQGTSEPWNKACDCVDYPVWIKELFFEHEEEKKPAEGVTNTGRDSKFFGVVVDRNRTGQMSTIAAVTGIYDTLAPAQVYMDLKNDLETAGVKSSPRRVYVSGDGGCQILTVDIEDMNDFACHETVQMSIQLVTSLDGSKSHHCRLVIKDKETQAEIVGFQTHTFNVTARHTKTIKERHAAFTTIIQSLIGRWNSEITPFIALMMDAKFDKQSALDFLEKLMSKAKIPERHMKKCMELYENDSIQRDKAEHTVYDAVRSVSSYIEDNMADKPERAELFRQNIARKSSTLIDQTVEKLRK